MVLDGWADLQLFWCSRQVCWRFLAEAPSAWQPVAGNCTKDFWLRPSQHGRLWQASVPKIFGQGPLGMVTCSRQLCWRFLAEAPLAWQPVAGKCAKDFGQGPLGMVVGWVPTTVICMLQDCCHNVVLPSWCTGSLILLVCYLCKSYYFHDDNSPVGWHISLGDTPTSGWPIISKPTLLLSWAPSSASPSQADTAMPDWPSITQRASQSSRVQHILKNHNKF